MYQIRQMKAICYVKYFIVVYWDGLMKMEIILHLNSLRPSDAYMRR